MPPPRAKPTLLLTLLTLAVFLPLLGRRDVVTSHEARVAQTARVMAHAGWPWRVQPVTIPDVKLGNDPGDDDPTRLRLVPDPARPPLHVNPWLVPVLNDEIRLQKPPLPYWCAAALFKLVSDDWSPALARLIPALLGALSTLLVYDLARRTLGRRFAAPAAFVFVSTHFVPDEFRKAMADPYLAFFALAATWGWIRGTTASLLACYASIGLGLLAKGPPFFIHFAVPVILYHALLRRRPPGRLSLHLLGIAITTALALPWPLYVLRHVPHAIDIWRYESIGELSENTENARPFWFYLPNLFLITLPWTPLFLLAIALPFKRRRTRPASFFPLAWLAVIVAFFSIVKLKKNAYLLPAMPAATLMAAQALVFCSIAWRKRIPRPRFLGHLAAIATIIAIALITIDQLIRTPSENARSPRPAAAFIRLALANEPGTTVLPDRLPPEATLYLPIDAHYDPAATTLLYLLDDPKNRAATDRNAFQKRVPERDVTYVRPITIPGDRARRYKLFALTLRPGPRTKELAAAPPPPP